MLSPRGEAMFPNLFKVSQRSGKYDIMVRFEKPDEMEGKEKERWDAMVAAAKQIAENEFGGKSLDKIPNPFRVGDPEDEYVNDPNSIYIRFGTTSRPGVVGPNPKVNLESGDVYGGMECCVSFNPKKYDVNGNTGITFYLNNVQKTADGERKGGERKEAHEEFDEVEESVAKGLFS